MLDIENINDSDKLINEIINQNHFFDVRKFLLYGYGASGAIIIISPNQTIKCLSKISHEKVAEKIYKILYDDFSNFNQVKNGYLTWQEQSCMLGCICIQLCTGFDGIAWLPNNINKYQYDELIDFNNSMNELNNALMKNGNNPINIISNRASLLLNKVIKNISLTSSDIKKEENMILRLKKKI